MAGMAIEQTLSADDPAKESDPAPLAHAAGAHPRPASDRHHRLAGGASAARGGAVARWPVISLPPHGRDAGQQVPISATLAANEALDRKRRAGERVLPMAFGEAGLPAHAILREALAANGGTNAYGPVAGRPALLEAAAGYWTRRGLPTSPGAVVSGPGSKPLLFGLLLALGADVAMPRPSWVSYAAQAAIIGTFPHLVPTPPGEGGVCDPARLARTVIKARAAGRRVGSVIVTLPDNPTGRLARLATVRALAEVAAEYGLVIISDEIYRDLRYDTAAPFPSPASVAPELTVVTTALSKSLALGGWRMGIARMPDGPLGHTLRQKLLGIGSEIWSAPSGPVQAAAALAFSEPPEITERVTRSRRLHAAVCRAVADRFAAAGVSVPAPQAAFYLYPDFAPWREHLAGYGVTTGADLAGLLLGRYGMGVLPASAFGEEDVALRLRVATGQLYGETDAERERALASPDPARLPWIAASLDRLSEILAGLAP